jgi:uncharacterized protein YdiU (UPF0061 family)
MEFWVCTLKKLEMTIKEKTIGWNFDNSYSNLPRSFIYEISPIPVKRPELVILNYDLASQMGLDFSKIDSEELAKIFSGNSLPKGTKSIAQAYAGHQFGHFTMLGDGRAVLLGEHISKSNQRLDVQFKGSGQTPFSRNGDGRAALGPMLREYLISEAMNSLNIPTTRSLAVVKTGENVIRERPLQGAILTRVASSHIRVGTFQFIRTRDNLDELNTLVDYTITRHYPEISKSKNKAYELLNKLIDQQIQLVVNWMRVGFIHGVMNTDNMAISGETIDYGPCAFMNNYNPDTCFSSIDHMGRYAFGNQPAITKWNLARFAECLLTLINPKKDESVKIATEVIDKFDRQYEEKWFGMMKNKLGLIGDDKNDKVLIFELLECMKEQGLDYTNTFCFLMGQEIDNKKDYQNDKFNNWKIKWQKRLTKDSEKLMKHNNPKIIPRNHNVESVLKSAEDNDLSPFNDLLKALKNPYTDSKVLSKYQSPPPKSDEKYQTFCGT